MKGIDASHLLTALEYMARAVASLPLVPGVLHGFAELVAAAEERGLGVGRKKIAQAEETCRRAISLSQGKYAKYHATSARILALQGKFDDARRSIRRALEAEDYQSMDYPARMTEYRLIEERVNLLEQQQKTLSVEARAMRELREFRGQLIATLGLLAAVIALIVTAFSSSSSSSDFATAAALMILQSALILFVFCGFAVSFRLGSWRLAAAGAVASLAAAAVALWIGGWIHA
ncbi:hypothetical protein [Microbacterium sp. CFBP 8794]|uniref:hypothetical protein n=1 Tax=Microbacterium sp. CFBP 8794 TaxID=2775269 RepID=UPI001782750C|nr:hypothetical protein [Microbacterium sp. CFBP 8794]MBD8478941.1 hypothetical protein [Microbacterium sp. CFBP 8794]